MTIKINMRNALLRFVFA